MTDVPKTPRVGALSTEDARRAGEEVGLDPRMVDLNIFRVLLQQPGVAKSVSDLLLSLLLRGRLDARLRELIIMRIAWVTGSVYEWAQHWRVARALQIPEEDLVAVRDWRGSDRFGDADRAVLAATDETVERGTIGPETWTACVEHVGGAAELVDLVTAIATWRFISSVVSSLEIPLEEGLEPWPPDGVAPASGT
jgi:alkylhydroperoxidase family enzyme